MERCSRSKTTRPIEAGILTKSIENAQKKVEAHNYESRKHVLEYDDVMNKQRTVIYAERRRVLEGFDLRPSIDGDRAAESRSWRSMRNCPDNVHPHEWDRAQILADLEQSVRGIEQARDAGAARAALKRRDGRPARDAKATRSTPKKKSGW